MLSLPSARRAALCLTLISPLMVMTACSSQPKPSTGLYVEMTNNNAADVSVLGCPEFCGTQGVGIQAGTDSGWIEPRIGIAYTITVNGVTSTCPPVLPRTKNSHGIYYVVTAVGRCELGSRRKGENTPE